MTAFFDTNVLVYTTTNDPRKARAEALLERGGIVSAQVFNEFVNVARGKLRKSWSEIDAAIDQFSIIFHEIAPLTRRTNALARALARDHGFAFYDALIVASALEAGCDTLFSEDMQHGRTIGALTIRDPFRQAAP